MNFCTLRVRQPLNEYIPAILVFGDVMSYGRDNDFVVSFDFPTSLRKVRGCSQMFQSKEPAKYFKNPIYKLGSVACWQMIGHTVRNNPVLEKHICKTRNRRL